MDDHDVAMLVLAVPAVGVMGREDPEALAFEGEFFAGLEEDAAAAVNDGVEFPIEPGMRTDGHLAKASLPAAYVADHAVKSERDRALPKHGIAQRWSWGTGGVVRDILWGRTITFIPALPNLGNAVFPYLLLCNPG